MLLPGVTGGLAAAGVLTGAAGVAGAGVLGADLTPVSGPLYWLLGPVIPNP